ncbi:class I SAM-dependent methyltransferase [Ekhidna sp.]
MYERLEACPSCEHKQFDNYMICDDHSVTGESFALVKCSNCDLVFTNPRPKEEALPKYYKSDQYISHTNKGNSLINIIYKLVRNYTLNQKVKLIKRLNGSSGTLLDYGCGTGDFIKIASNNKWQAFGYEPDEDARKIASEKNNKSILKSLKESPQELDIITLWHVLEHVSELKETARDLKKRLKKGGYMIVAVPNHNSFDAQVYKEYWAAYDVPRHLYHFDRVSIENLAKKLKLQVVETLPMKFDSYYVSMLSEKYKNSGSLLRAIKTGFLSNKKARKSKEYSSLIYILQK